MDSKTKAIVAHVTVIGWIVALVVNQGENKDEFASFYIRQMLGLIILSVLLSVIPIVNIIGWILAVVLWIMSLLGAAEGTLKPTPLLGEHFQTWFSSL